MIKKLIPSNVETVLQAAVHAELAASHLYKHLANQCQRIGLFGAAKFFRQESADELEHYQGIADYLNDRGCVADIPSLDAIDDAITGLRDAVEMAYETEVELSKSYSKWWEAADPATKQFLLKYIKIQAKSAGEYGDLLARLNLAGDDQCAVLIIDKEMGE